MKKIYLIIATMLTLSAFAQIPEPGAYYPFCGNTNNLKNSNYPAVPANATLTWDRFSNPSSAYNFNGTSAYMTFPITVMSQFDSYSYSMWIKPAATSTVSKIFYFGGADNSGQYLTFNSANRFTAVGWCYTSNFSTYTSVSITSASVTLNEWHHVAVTRDNGYIRIYIDGVKTPDDSWAFIGGLAAYYGSFPQRMIMGAMTSQSEFFKGDIDDVRFYSPGALNQAQVTALYQEGPVPEITVRSGTVCSGESFVIDPSGASTYTFSSGSATVAPVASTDYTVTGKNAAGCVSNTTLNVHVDACTSLKKITGENAFIIYPNPNNGMFNIQINAAYENAFFMLEDLAGRHIKTIHLSGNKEDVSVDTQDLSGCYTGKFYSDGKCVFQRKIIVTH